MTYIIERHRVVPGNEVEVRTLSDLEIDIDRLVPEIAQMFEIGRISFIYDDDGRPEAILASDEEALSTVTSLLGIRK